jgi:RNA polymerase sigma factor (sigma-70 family)
MNPGGPRPANVFQTPEHYRRLRTKLVVYFEGRRCWHAEDLADESISRLIAYAATVDFDGNADALAFGIARNVLKEWLRKSNSEIGDQELVGTAPYPHSDAESAALAAHALEMLDPDDRELIEQYYIDGSTAGELALVWGLSPAGIRTRIFRLRTRLLKFLGRE